MTAPHLELGPPDKLPEGGLRIVPLGGLGAVGRNMAVFEFKGRLLIIDCGVLFPDDLREPGVDLILPDFSYIEDRLEDVEALVLTHGHEDHIGAVPYLLKLREDMPLVGSKLTLALVEAKLKEHRLTPVLHEVREGQREQYGPFECEFIAVNHSIPDALAVAIRTEAGTVLHTGDFKMDQLPLDGRITDLRAFARLGEEGVDLFMTDSTNAEVPGFNMAERDIGEVLDRVFEKATGRLVVASFASHIHRVQQVLNTAASHSRRVAFVGRSMVRNMNIATELGYLDPPPGVVVDLKDVESLPDDQIVLMSTGSQGEPMAALARMAHGSHNITIGPGDTVVLASSLIPGNENAIYRVINGLTRLGANVVHQSNAKVHVSGHASAGELLYCYNIVQPTNVMPVHGEIRHLVANGALAVQTGVDPQRVVLAEDGIVVDMVEGKARISGAVPCEYVYVDGRSIGEVTEDELQDRRVLSSEGFISVFAVVDLKKGKLLSEPHIHARGVAEEEERFETILPEVAAALEASLADGQRDLNRLQQVVRRTVGQWAGKKLRRRPMIVPVVTAV